MTGRRSGSRFWRQVKIISGLVILALAAMGGIVWFLDRPLREAKQLLDAGRPEEALQLLDSWDSSRADSSAADAIRARCLVQTGRSAAAFRIFSLVGAETPDEIHAWALACLHLQRWDEALPLLTAVHQERPDDADILHELAACHAKLGDLDLALHFAQLFGEFPEFRSRGLLLKGMLLRQLGRKSDAAAEWKTLVETDNELTGLQVSAAEFLLQYGGLELEQGNPEHAAELLQRSAQLDETAETRYQLGQAEEQLGQEENAGVNWERALELNADHASARESLARLALKRNQPDRAEELLTPILNDRQLTASTAYLMQRVCTVQGNADGAAIWQARTEKLKNREYIRNTMTQLLRDDGQSYWAQVIRSYQFAEAGNWLQAEHALESLADEEDEHEFVRMLRGAVTKRGQLPPIDTFPVRLF